MGIRVVLTALLVSVVVPASRAQSAWALDRASPPADPQLPIPLGSTRPEKGNFILWLGPFVGAGWQFADGSSIEIRSSPISCFYRRPVYDTEDFRQSVLVGNQLGAAVEWYLGHGFAAEFQASFPLMRPFLSLSWYPVEYIRVQFDPFHGIAVCLSL